MIVPSIVSVTIRSVLVVVFLNTKRFIIDQQDALVKQVSNSVDYALSQT